MKRIFSVLPLTLAAVGVTAAVAAAVMTVSGAAALPGWLTSGAPESSETPVTVSDVYPVGEAPDESFLRPVTPAPDVSGDSSDLSDGSAELSQPVSNTVSELSVPESGNDESGEMRRTFSGVRVEVVGEDRFVAEGFDLTVTIRVSGDAEVMESLDPSDISVYADVSKAKRAGGFEVRLAADTPEGVDVDSITPKYTIVMLKDTQQTASDESEPQDSGGGQSSGGQSSVPDESVCSDEGQSSSMDSVPDESVPDENTSASMESDPEASVPEESEPAESQPDDVFISNGIIISGDRGMEPFGGSELSGELTAQRLNRFKLSMGDKVSVYIMPIPTASAFYAPDEYSASIYCHLDCFEALRDNLVNVGYIDVLSELEKHKDENIYLRTDHHWGALGAYYAARLFAGQLQLPFTDISGFTSASFDFVGALYNYSKAEVLKDNPDKFVYYIPRQSYTCDYHTADTFEYVFTGSLFSSSSSYSKFIYGDSYSVHIKTGVNNGRKLLIYKESYGNALAPFLISSFEEIYIADIRYTRVNAKELVERFGITDVCFALGSFSVAGSRAEYIDKLTEY